MTPEYELDQENVFLSVIPRDVPADVTESAGPATLKEHETTCQIATSDALLIEPAQTSEECPPIASVAGIATPESSVSDNSSSFESLIELVTEAADSVRELMTPCLTAHGLNDARFTIMRAIRGSKNGECSQSELARCLKQSEANVSTLLDRMRGDALVSREKSPFDRRRSVVRLTDKGEQQLTLTEQDYTTRARGVLRAFDVFEIQAFRDQLRSFIAIWETELELVSSNNAVAGRIGGNATDSHSEGTETRHAQAG